MSQADRAIGHQLATWLQSNGARGANTGMLQGIVADLAGERSDLIVPLKDLVCRPAFQSLLPLAGSGRGHLQRDALLQEISRTFAPSVVAMISEVLSGFLGIPPGSSAGGTTTTADTTDLGARGMGAAPSGFSSGQATSAPATLLEDEESAHRAGNAASPSPPAATPSPQAAGSDDQGGVSNRRLMAIAAGCALLTTVVVGALRTPLACGVLGLCPADTDSSAPASPEAPSPSNPAPSQAAASTADDLNRARRAEEAMRSAGSLEEHQRSLQELEQALGSLNGAQLSPAEAGQQRALAQAAEQGRQLLQEEVRYSREVRQLETLLAPQAQSSGNLQEARATLDRIPARSFSASEAGRLRASLERLEQEEAARIAARRAAAAAQAQRPRLPAANPRPSAPYREEPLW